MSGLHAVAYRWLLMGILAVAAGFNLTNIDFAVEFHADEPTKVEFIQRSTQNFYHPLLMLQLVRAVNLAAGFMDSMAIATLGRALMGLCGVATVFGAYLLARRAVPPATAVATAASVAVAPTLVLHAHYLKEDTILTACLMASIVCFFRFVERPGRRSALWLGIATGMAFSSHYKAILLVPLYLAAPLVGTLPGHERYPLLRRFYAPLSLAGLIAGAVFLGINWPLLLDPQAFLSGVMFEADHAQVGHDVPITALDTWLGFHLRYSLVPGMGIAAVAVALAGLGMNVARWAALRFRDRWLAAYVLLFYLVPEVSPLKPFPDFSRYMLPIVPPLLYFAWQAVSWAATSWRHGSQRALVYAVGIVLLVLLPASVSIRLVAGLASDTRVDAATWLAAHPGMAVVETYAGTSWSTWSVALLDPAELRQRNIDYVVASSFMYDRFALGARLRDPAPSIRAIHEGYTKLFERPFVEIAPAYRPFAFSNPVIRIVDVRQAAPR